MNAHSHHLFRIKKMYFGQIESGEKTLEVRVGYNQIKQVKTGDTICFENYGNSHFEVIRVTRYGSFDEMLRHEDPGKIMPGMSKLQVKHALGKIYPASKERLGVYVIELRKVDSILVTTASKLAATDKVDFTKTMATAYAVTDFICRDYPYHFEWYWTKFMPGIWKGNRQAVICKKHGQIAGVTFLKKDDIEKKICTLLVLPEHRGYGVASAVLEESFSYLGTNKPLISFADHKIEMFRPIINKYGWEQTQVLGDGYYNGHSKELVFNGVIV